MKIRTITIAAILTLTAAVALAYVQPIEGQFGYDIYNLFINKIIKGPLGFTIGVALLVFSWVITWVNGRLVSAWYIPFFGSVLASIIFNADKIVLSLGAVI